MDERAIGIQPCCIARELPPLIEGGGASSFFYSHGDWGFAKLWDAASQLVPCGAGSPVHTFLAMEDVDVFALRHIRRYFERGWTDSLTLCVATDARSVVSTELSGYLDAVCYCVDRKEARRNHLWVRSAESGRTLVVSGPLHWGGGYREVCTYAASLTDDTRRAAQALAAWRPSVRLHAAHRGTCNGLKWLQQMF